MYSVKGGLQPTPPFDFAKSLDFLRMFPLMREDQVQGSGLTNAIIINHQTLAFEVRSTGTIRQPRLKYTLYSENPVSVRLQRAVEDRLGFFLSIEDRLKMFYKIACGDDCFRPVVERFYGLHQVKFLTPFESACWAVLSQRTVMSEARRARNAFLKRFGSMIRVENHEYWAFPEPSRIADTSRDDILEVTHNRRKAEYLAEVAKAFNSIDEKFLRTGNYAKVEAWLEGIKGIGEWSARLVLLRGLGRMDELGVEKRLLSAFSQVYGKTGPVGRESFDEVATRYGGLKGYWAYYLRAASLEESPSLTP
jgi:DNA-3-methyladenine glycosylase II